MGVTGRKLKVVTWKCLVMRRRHWILTLFEILIPTLSFAGLLYGLSVIPESSSQIPANAPEAKSSDAIIKSTYAAHIRVKYCPSRPETDAFMKQFHNELKNHFTLTQIDFHGYDSEIVMMKHFKEETMTPNETDYMSYQMTRDLGVVINEFSKEKKKFDYTIRTTRVPDTSSLFPGSMQPGPGSEFQTYALFFVPMQLLLDQVFTSVVTSGTSKVTLLVQSNPYPEYTKSYGQIFDIGFPSVTAISFLFLFPLILTTVVQEKISGVKELQQMMGLPSWMIWYGFLFNSLLTTLISMGIVVTLLVSGPHSFHLFQYADPTVLFALLVLYVTSCIFYCFLVASVFLKPTPSLIFGLVSWVAMLIVIPYHIKSLSREYIQFLATFFPGYAMICVFRQLGNFEANGIGLTWSNLFETSGNSNTISVGVLFSNMIMSILVLGILTWYVDNVRPGPYGLRKSYLFFLKKSYWTNNTKKIQSVTDHTNYTATFEQPPPNAKVGIRVRDLSKSYGNFVAVDNVSIDFYEGQITALLGHNGAGKTTTMSIISGMFPPSSGEVTAQDFNIFKHMDQFRDSLGLCPQHNLLFPYLSVIQHLIFFGMIKGLTRKESKKSGLDLLKMLNMLEKRNQPVSNLSGGMKRKLQLAIALIGAPKVLMLDEPTSGMDPESRREMWDLLLSLRGGRTIIITTHFMEEADVLGDRIAIMDHGKIKCYGTTLFLKKIYGAGYQLTFQIKDGSSQSQKDAITSLVQTHVPNSSLHTTQGAQLSYTLPTQDTSRFSELFVALEKKKESLGISSMGIACTTIEEVFLKVGGLASKDTADASPGNKDKRSPPEHPVGNGESNKEPLIHQKVKGVHLFMQRFSSLIQKRCIYFRRRWISNLLHALSFIFAMGFAIFVTRITANPAANPNLKFSPTVYEDSVYFVQDKTSGAGTPGAKVAAMYTQELPSTSSERLLKYTPKDNLTEKLLDIGRQKEQMYRTRLLGGLSIADNQATVLFNTIPLHAMPISINMINNALLRTVSGVSTAMVITSNHPIDYDAVPICEGTLDPASLIAIMSSFLWVIIMILIMPIWISMYFNFPVVERINNCKQLQLMTGVSCRTYWLALFVFDYATVLIVLILGFLVLIVYDVTNMHLIAYPTELGVLFLMMLVFVAAMLLFTYSYSLVAAGAESLGYYFVLNIVFCPLILGLSLPEYSGLWYLLYICSVLGNCIFPLPSLAHGVFDIIYLALYKSRCHLCPDNHVIQADCANITNISSMRFPTEEDSIALPGHPVGWPFVFLLINIGVHSLFIACSELQIGGMIAKFIVDKFYSDSESSFDQPDGANLSKDSDVQREKDRVDGLMQGKQDPEDSNQPIFIVQNLMMTFFFVKRMWKLLPRPGFFRAVRGISFAVSPGECFGLLGVNGAGKTTTFRMLTGDLVCTHGNATLFNYSLRERKQYIQGIGYCPQFNGINETLTAQEMLECFAALRGIPAAKADRIINYWIELLGLGEYRHRRSGHYSGGNKRKLSTAMALIGDPPLVFLDEPTSGVDPISRHRLWTVLSQIQRTGQSIVLTSHSMDECEALCNRLTIMVRGKMQCLGNITYLKQRYGQGFTLMIKLREGDVDALKAIIRREFQDKVEIKDEHKSLIHYQILDPSLAWSYLFAKLESIKSSVDIVEDYSLSNTTLEQIFIAFAKGKTGTDT